MYIFALTPIIGLSWPALTPLIFAAAGALGYKVLVDMKEGGDINELLRQRLQEDTTIKLRIDDLVLDAVQDEIKRAQSMYFQRGELVLAIIKDERGKFRIEVTGPKNADKKMMELEGRAFAEELAQMFAQNRAVEELAKLGMDVTDEMKDEETEDIVLKITRWT